MASETPIFVESTFTSKPIRDLKLTLEGTPLAAIVHEFEDELARAGLTQVKPRFYLSTEWGVPFGTIAIAIPFYLASEHLTALHASRNGHVEGMERADILRYLRHEMGHVVSYAYRLYEEKAWVARFGSITQPYEEEYRPSPFSRRFVRHLPGWYAQKHPDEDWAETFAVCISPDIDWRREYADWPEALAKLEYCARTLEALKRRPPLVTDAALDEDVGDIGYSLDHYYGAGAGLTASGSPAAASSSSPYAPGLDGALRTIFEDLHASGARTPASKLIARHERKLMANVYRWTGHFPEHTRALLRHLAGRADGLALSFPQAKETAAAVALTTLVTALAMNHVHHGRYLP